MDGSEDDPWRPGGVAAGSTQTHTKITNSELKLLSHLGKYISMHYDKLTTETDESRHTGQTNNR